MSVKHDFIDFLVEQCTNLSNILDNIPTESHISDLISSVEDAVEYEVEVHGEDPNADTSVKVSLNDKVVDRGRKMVDSGLSDARSGTESVLNAFHTQLLDLARADFSRIGAEKWSADDEDDDFMRFEEWLNVARGAGAELEMATLLMSTFAPDHPYSDVFALSNSQSWPVVCKVLDVFHPTTKMWKEPVYKAAHARSFSLIANLWGEKATQYAEYGKQQHKTVCDELSALGMSYPQFIKAGNVFHSAKDLPQKLERLLELDQMEQVLFPLDNPVEGNVGETSLFGLQGKVSHASVMHILKSDSKYAQQESAYSKFVLEKYIPQTTTAVRPRKM